MNLTHSHNSRFQWPVLSELSRIERELHRFWGGASAGTETGVWAPAVDLAEDKDAYTVQAEVPGLTKEAIEVSLHEGVLTIAGERKFEAQEAAENHRVERFHGRFQRTIELPAAVEAGQVKASYKDGVLTVTLPKAEAAKPKQIEVKVS